MVVSGGAISSIGLGDGTGSFQPEKISGARVCCQTGAADFNRDGNPDLIAANGTNLSLFLGNGDGTFQFPNIPNSPTGTAYNALAAADLNDDGIPDVVAVNNALGGPLSVMLGNGDGTFANPVNYPVGDCPESVAIGDLNQDGHIDLVIALRSGRVVVLLGNGDGTFQPAINFGSAFPPGTNGGANVVLPLPMSMATGFPTS